MAEGTEEQSGESGAEERAGEQGDTPLGGTPGEGGEGTNPAAGTEPIEEQGNPGQTQTPAADDDVGVPSDEDAGSET
jgi:hypothetical protein